MSSQSAGNEPPTIPGSSTHNPTQSTQVATFRNVESLTDAVLSILKDTVWPRRSTNTARGLVAIIENASSLKSIPKNDHHIKAEKLSSLEQFIAVLGRVRPKLQEASDTYGAKERRFRSKIKYLSTYLDRNKCTQLLESCRNEVTGALAALPENWTLETITEDQPDRSNNSQPQADTPLTRSDLPATVMKDRIDHEPDPVPQIVTSEDTIAIPPPSQDEGSAAAGDQVKDSPNRREWLGPVKTMFNAVESVSGMIPVIGTYVGAAAKVGSTVVEIIQQMGDNEEAAEGLTSHTRQLSDMLQRFENGSVDQNKGELTALISNLQRELQEVQQRITELSSSNALKKAFSSAERAEALKGYQDTIRTALEQIQLLATLNTTTLITELYDKGIREEQQRLLDRLGDASYGARGDSIDDVICLKGTRVAILERINAWIRSTSSSDKVLWIRGMAGRGKSTIAATVAHRWKYQAASAIFHFRRGQNETDNRLVCALARQLGSSILVPEVKEAILNSIREKPDIGRGRLRDQFMAMFGRSLSRIQNTSVPILLVVDALDECEDVHYAVNFVKLLDEISSSLPVNVKFLLTTRPEAPLIDVLEPRQWHAENLDEETAIDDDIAAFLEHGFSRIRRDKAKYELKEDWPSRENMGAILQMSQGLFQWARTAIEYMMEGSPEDRLQELLDLPGICSGMDDLYLKILSKAFEKAKKNPLRGEVFVHLLGTLIAAPYPISLEIFAYLVADHPAIQNKSPTDTVRYLRLEVLGDLGSLIHVPDSSTGPIRLMHTSIRDLLVDVERCKREPYSVDLASRHGYLASKCLERMERDLKTNICDLSDLSKPNSDSEIQALVRESVPQGLQYCCRNWSPHLIQGVTGLAGDAVAIVLSKFEHLCKEKLLGWLEVISLIGETQTSITVAKRMQLWLQEHCDAFDPWLSVLWNDMWRFTTLYHEPIAFGALHIYASALPFCPVKTTLWKNYSSFATTRVLNGIHSTTWPSALWTKMTGSEVNEIAFSPNGKLLVFGSCDRTIQLWDTETGAPIGEPLIGHDRAVVSVCFSPDGKLFASGSLDKTIRLWDVETGAPIGEPLRGHKDSVHSICFSQNGKLLASGSHDRTIQLWDAGNREPIGEPLRGHKNSVWSVCFSPNAKLLASGSHDMTIRLWNAETGASIGKPLRGHDDLVWSVCFSPNERLLASGSQDKTIRLWDTETGAPIGEPLRGHTESVLSVCFSPNGKLLASGSYDNTICLWAAETGAPIGDPLRGHNKAVVSVSFSPNGKLLASGSTDKTIRLRDAEIEAPIGEPLRGHGDAVWSICFSPNGKLVASGSHDKTIRLWDAETGAPVGEPLRGHDEAVVSVCFSSNGKLLASGSDDNTIRLWNVKTGMPIGEPLKGHDSSVNSVCVSSNGKLLASGSEDKTIRLWDVETGMPIGGPLRGHDEAVTSVCFSLDGKLFASGSFDNTIWLWDAETGAPIGEPLAGHDGAVQSVCFSSSGKLLASGSNDNTIRLWNVKTGIPIGEPLRGHDSSVYSVCFSSNGKLLASGSDDRTIQLWDAENREPIGEPLRGHKNSVWSVCFSPNAKLLASGSGDTIQFWDAETRAPIGEPLRGHDSSVHSVCFSPNGKLVASGSEDKTIRLWNAETGAPVGEPLRGHGGAVQSVCFSPNGKLLASGSWDWTIWLWDAETRAPIGDPLTGHKLCVWSLCFSPNGKLLASGSRDWTIWLWDAETRVPIGKPLRGHKDSVQSVCFSPNGKFLASGSEDKTIGLWNVQNGTPIGEPLRGHQGPVQSVCFSPNGKLLASGSDDKTIRLWNAETGAPNGEPLRGHDPSLSSVCFSPDGKYLLAHNQIIWHDSGPHATSNSSLIHTSASDTVSLVPRSNTIDQPNLSHQPSLQLPFATPLGHEGQWVMFLSKRLLWFPPQYWSDTPQILLSHSRLVFIFGEWVLFSDISGCHLV